MQRCDASAALGESLSRQRVSTCRTGRSSTHIYIFSDESLSIGDRLFGFRYNVQPSSTERSCARHELQANSRSPNRDATFVIYDAIKQVTEVIGNTIHNRKLQSRFRRELLQMQVLNSRLVIFVKSGNEKIRFRVFNTLLRSLRLEYRASQTVENWVCTVGEW
ncbi:uncharacterized protein K444DRAFT_233424 [Hyaloscypha bicolor E]|uniref:Uncharacterized protein n=1 Tax=Hyaloscypha bicolor E TaxID=1095630 RepID=A0A2J6SL53_9HELO|nr:uncharacterized protein K444DRAFT_233424 [Hyaloscypha bicolor E]PMD51499.1 hypothetical protein K444DRAFT_233424 [Hyaloscypha bicolor E]